MRFTQFLIYKQTYRVTVVTCGKLLLTYDHPVYLLVQGHNVSRLHALASGPSNSNTGPEQEYISNCHWDPVQGCTHLLGQRFRARFVLKFDFERGEKGQSANFKTKHTEPLTPEITLALYMYLNSTHCMYSHCARPRSSA